MKKKDDTRIKVESEYAVAAAYTDEPTVPAQQGHSPRTRLTLIGWQTPTRKEKS